MYLLLKKNKKFSILTYYRYKIAYLLSFKKSKHYRDKYMKLKAIKKERNVGL